MQTFSFKLKLKFLQRYFCNDNFRLFVDLPEMTLENSPKILIKLALKRGLQVQLNSLVEFRSQVREERQLEMLDHSIDQVRTKLNETIASLFSLQQEVIATEEIVEPFSPTN